MPPINRRQLLTRLGAATALALPLAPARAQTGARPLRLLQLLDSAPDQHDLSRDYAAGLRLALAEQARGGKPLLQLQTLSVDGRSAELQPLLRGALEDPGVVALLGNVGETLALGALAATRSLGLEIAHLAPWLADTRHDGGGEVFPLFASRDVQIRGAVQALASMGVNEIGLVYSSAALEQALQLGLQQDTTRLGLRSRRYTAGPGQDAATLGNTLPRDAPAVLLFLGGNVELALFVQSLARRGLVRFVVCLADVDAGTLAQMGVGRQVPLIFTQVVPNPHASAMPLVRRYRATLKELYEEEPSPLSLAGYVAGSHALRALATLPPGASRATVLAQLRRREPLDLEGWQVRFAEGRASRYVNQTMWSAGGRLIG